MNVIGILMGIKRSFVIDETQQMLDGY
jgi:hypothetical protein